jgi:protein-disulfide isomerase
VLRYRSYAFLASAVALLFFGALNAITHSRAADSPPAQAAPSAAPLPEMALGKADAPVTIVEYSSLSCPHCAVFHRDVLPVLKKDYIDTGKVRYVVREFPLNDAALAGAVVARCLDPSRYFAFIDLLFSRQREWATEADAFTPLKEFAKQAGMTPEEFDKCIDNDALQQQILSTRDEGQKKGVNATPSFFINGKLFDGRPTIEGFAEAIKPYVSTQ